MTSQLEFVREEYKPPMQVRGGILRLGGLGPETKFSMRTKFVRRGSSDRLINRMYSSDSGWH